MLHTNNYMEGPGVPQYNNKAHPGTKRKGKLSRTEIIQVQVNDSNKKQVISSPTEC